MHILSNSTINNCKVTVNGKDAYTVNVDGNIVNGFRVETATGNVVIRVSRDKAGQPWGFEAMELRLAFDFGASREEIKNVSILDRTKLNENIIDKTDLEAAATAIEKRVKTVEAGLALVGDVSATDADLFKAYQTWQLFKTPSKLKSDADALNADIKAHNAAVKAANDAYANQQENIANRTEFRQVHADLTKAVDGTMNPATGELEGGLLQTLKAQIEASKDATEKAQLQKYYDEALKLSADVKAFGTTIEDTYSNLDIKAADAKKKLNAIAVELNDKYVELDAAAGGSSDDIDAYKAFSKDTFSKNPNYVAYLSLENLYLQYQTAMSLLEGNKGYEKVFADAISMVYGRNLTETYEAIRDLVVVDRSKGTISLLNITGAAQKAPEVKAAFELGLAGVGSADAPEGSLTAIMNAANAFVADQNAAKTAADKVVAALQGQYKKVAAHTVPANFQTAFNSKLSAANGAISAIEKLINDAYGNIETGKALSEATYSGSLVDNNGVKTTQKQLDVEEYLAGIQPVVDAATDFATLKSEVARVDINGMLAEIVADDYAALDKAISALTPDNYKKPNDPKTGFINAETINGKIAEINDLVLGTDSEVGLVTAFDMANCDNEIASLEKFIADRQMVDGAKDLNNKGAQVDFNKGTYTGKMFVTIKVNNKDTKVSFADRSKTFADQVVKAVADNEGSVRAIRDAIVKIGQSADVVALQKAIADLRAEFNEASADANVRAAQNAYDEIKGALDQINSLNEDNKNWKNIDVTKEMSAATTALGKITAARDAALAQTSVSKQESESAKLYKSVNDFMGKEIKNLNTKYKDILDNVKAYNSLLASAEAISADAIQEVADYNDSNSFMNGMKDTAWDFYNKKVEGFKTTAKKINEDIEKAVLADKVANNAYSQKTALEGRINALAGQMSDLVKAIRANEDAHNELLGEAEVVRQLIDQIDAKVNSGFNPWDAETKEVSDLLLAANQAITSDYNKGESASGKVARLAELAEITVKANSIIEKFNSDYTNEIRKQNEALFQQTWSGDKGAYGSLYATYTNAVDAATGYELLKNRGYKAHVNAWESTDKDGNKVVGYGNIAELTQYITKLNEVNLKANAYLQKLTADDKNPKLLNTADKDLAECIAEANGYKAKIAEVAAEMKTRVDNAGKAYYAEQQPRADEAITFNKALLSGNGVADNAHKYQIVSNGKNTDVTKKVTEFTKATKSVDDAIKAAKDSYTKNLTKNIGKEMDNIATNLDKAQKLTANEANQWGANMWNATTAAYDEFIASWTADMATFVQDANRNDVKNGNTVVTKGNLTKFNEAVKAVNDLKASVAKAVTTDGKKYITLNEDETSSNELVAWLTALDNNIETVYGIYKAARDNHQANATAAQQYQAYISGLTAADGVETLYNELKSFTNSLAAANDTYHPAKESLDDIKEAIEDNKADYTNAKAGIDAMIADFKANLSIWYSNVASAELSALRGQYTLVNSALNEAYVQGIEGFEDYQKEVVALNGQLYGSADGIAKNIAAAQAADTAEGIIKGVKGLKDEMRAMENKLASLEVTLKKNNPLPGVISTLNEKYDAVKTVVDKANGIVASFDEVVAKNFAGFVAADYAGKLDAVKSLYSTEGNITLMQQDNYIVAMDEILDAVNKALVSIEETKALVDASQSVFDTLKAELDKYVQQSNELSDLVAGYEFYKYTTKYTAEELAEKFTPEQIEALTELEKYDTQAQVEKYEKLFDAANARIQAALDFITAKNTNADVKKRLTAADNINDFIEDSYDEENNEIKGFKGILANDIELAVTGEEGTGALNVWDYEGQRVATAIKNPFLLANAKADLIAKAKAVGDKKQAIKKGEPDASKKITPADVNKAYAAALTEVIEEIRAITAEAIENSFKPGDLNNDGETNIFDVSEFSTILANAVTYEELLAESETKAKAADLNYDKKFQVGDLVLISKLAIGRMSDEDFLPKAAPAQGMNMVSVALESVEGGISRYAVNVQNAAAFVAGQIDFVLGDGMTIVSVEGAERAAAHNLVLADNNSRVVLFNMENAAIDGANGAVIYVEVFGEGKFDVDNVIFATKTGAEVVLAKPEGTTGIEDTVIDGNGGMKQRIYNAAGQMLRGIQRGVNIIRNADGSVTKEYHK